MDNDVELDRLNVDALVGRGCDLSDIGRHVEAERCFRAAVELGEEWVAFNLGNALVALGRTVEAVAAYERALTAGETDAWLNLGSALEELGDLAGAMRAYREAFAAGQPVGAIALACLLQEQGERDEAERVVGAAADGGDAEAAAILACWRWDRTEDPSLESALRAGAEHHPSARVDLAALLRGSGRVAEAREVLERGAARGEVESWLPLGNLHADERRDDVAAEAAYRAGIGGGDVHSHHNLGVLLERRGDVDGAAEEYARGAAAGDALAARALRELSGG